MSESRTDTPFEDKEIRCPKLGGQVSFSYCRIETLGRPCSRAVRCWSEQFDAEQYFRQQMSDEDFAAVFLAPPPSKMGTLLELIEQAKKVAEEKKSSQE